MREQILAIINQGESSSHLFAFESIPPRQLARAQKSYANTGNEPTILLYDSSIFGVRAGFVLTPMRLFYKDIAGQGAANVMDIVNITFSADAMVEPSLLVQTNTAMFPIGVWNRSGSQGSDVLRVLKGAIGVLQGRPLGQDKSPMQEEALPKPVQEKIQPQPAPEKRLVQCSGCGARYVGSAAKCDYCGCPV
ncbi:MAG: hypothetical protein FWD06_04590 [Oscillospiraceae bacterium]|nr:hypothetical protein [Oscillospiraceae bacterium]